MIVCVCYLMYIHVHVVHGSDGGIETTSLGFRVH